MSYFYVFSSFSSFYPILTILFCDFSQQKSCCKTSFLNFAVYHSIPQILRHAHYFHCCSQKSSYYLSFLKIVRAFPSIHFHLLFNCIFLQWHSFHPICFPYQPPVLAGFLFGQDCVPDTVFYNTDRHPDNRLRNGFPAPV